MFPRNALSMSCSQLIFKAFTCGISDSMVANTTASSRDRLRPKVCENSIV